MDKAVFGLIGVGGIAQSQHLPNMTRAPHVHLKTVCDLREDLLKKMQEKYKIPHATTKHAELLADPEIQAIVVATHEDVQAQLSIEAVQAGKHVYVEKPLAKTAEQCKEVADAAKATGKFVAVGFNRRFAPAYRKAKELLATHGGAKNMHYRIADEYACGWGKDLPPGYHVIVELCHIFDILRFFADSDVESVYCVESRDDDEIITLKFASGTVASIMSSGYATMDLPKERLEIIADTGGVTVEEFVELRTYGLEDAEPVYRFCGHTHPDQEFTHKYLFEKEGANALYAVRRMGWELRERHRQTEKSGQFHPDNAELDVYMSGRSPHWNYMMDKGWLWAIDHLGTCIVDETTPLNATAQDAWKASVLAHAAIESRSSGQVVRL